MTILNQCKQEHSSNMCYINTVAGHNCDTVFGIPITPANSKELVRQLRLYNNDITKLNLCVLRQLNDVFYS